MQEPTFLNLNCLILKIIDNDNASDNSFTQLYERNLAALKLIQNIPALRHSLHNDILLLFEEGIKIHVVNSNIDINEGKTDLPDQLKEYIEIIKLEIRILIDTNCEFWGYLIFQWVIEFLAKVTLKFADQFFNTELDTLLDYFRKCHWVMYLLDILEYIIFVSRSNCLNYEVELLGILTSNTIAIYPKSLWIFSTYSVCFYDSKVFQTLIHQNIDIIAENFDPITLKRKFYDYLLQMCLHSYSLKFNTTLIIMDLISISIHSNLNHEEIFIGSCINMINDALSESSSHHYSPIIPMILHIISDNLSFFEKYIEVILKGLNFNSCALKSQISFFEEKFQIDICHKIASILMNLPLYDLKIVDFLIYVLKQKSTISSMYVTIFIIINDYCRDVINLNINGSVPLVSSHFLMRMANNLNYLISIILENYKSVSCCLIFSLVFSVGYFGGSLVMTKILITLIKDDNFNIVSFNILMKFLSAFSIKFPSLSKNIFICIAQERELYTCIQFSIILKNLKKCIYYERKLCNNRLCFPSIEKGFEKSYNYFLKIIPDLSMRELDDILNFFSIFNSNVFKNFKNFDDSYNGFTIILEIITLISDGTFECSTAVWRFVSKIVRLVFVSSIGFKHIFLHKILDNLIKNDFYSTNEIQNKSDDKKNIFEADMFREFMNSLKINEKSRPRSSSKRFEILIFFQSFYLNLFSDILNPNENSQDSSQFDLNIYCSIFIKTITGEVDYNNEWPPEEKCIRVQNHEKFSNMVFDNSIFRFFIQVISYCLPKNVNYGTMIRYLLSNCLLDWFSFKNSKPSYKLIERTEFLIKILLSAEWLPMNFVSLHEMLKSIRPIDVYYLLSCIWTIYLHKYESCSSSDDSEFRQIIFSRDDFSPFFSAIRGIIIKDIKNLGSFYSKIFK